MEPVLQRLGDVTIQRLEKPKGPPKVGPQSDISSISLEKPRELREPTEGEENPSSAEDDSGDYEVQQEGQGVKRTTSESSDIAAKKFKFENQQSDKKCIEQSDELSVHSFSENDITDYDSDLDSELESEGDLGNDDAHMEVSRKTFIENIENKEPVKQTAVPSTSEMTNPAKDEEDDEDSNGESFFEKLVEQAEVATTPTSTPDSTPPKPSDATQDEDYEIDIKEKLKEMGEITFGTVKKGDKPKKSDVSAENEVVITSKKPGADEEVLGTAKGMLRRNIREVMDDTKLDEATLAAQRLEAERLRRVQEQQRVLREYQRQAAQERAQQRAAALLQGSSYNKPGTSQTRIGNTVLVKLPNGQTKPMTKYPRHPFEFMRGPPGGPPLPPGAPMSALKAQPRSVLHKKPGSHLTPSVSIAPVGGKRPFFPPMMKPHSDSDSENEDKKPIISPEQKQKAKEGVQTIDISSDDDCIVVSDPEADQGDESDHDDPSNSGMHTNDEFNQPDDQGRVLVNVAHAEDEPDVFVAPQIARIIKPHQIGGVRFLYDNLIESVNRFATSSGFGCILAHSMGLGKTLQIVTFSDIFLRYTPARTVLCIMPINTLQNWMAEFNMWLPKTEAAPASPLNSHGEVRPRNFNIFVLNDSHKTLPARARVIREWRSGGGVLMIGYEQYRLLSLKKTPKPRKKSNPMMDMLHENDKNRALFDEVHQALVQPGPDLVICDEGHRIKNSHASISQALKQMRTKRRVVLTGYPLQNNLMEYWCMVDFVRPNYLGTKTEFCNMFERPIMNGQCIDSTEADIKLMRYRAHVLHSLLVGFVQRRSHRVLHATLPQKEEYVLLVRMTTFQRKLYDTFMNEVVRRQSVPNPLKAFAVCCKIWNHPDVLYNFLKKKAGGEAVDIDLEEVASTVSGAPSLVPEIGKAKRGAPTKPRKTPAKGKNGKPAASVTPYNSNSEANNIQTPPVQVPSGIVNQANSTNSNGAPITSFANTISQGVGGDGNQSSLGQNRTNFENLNFEDPPISQPYYDTHFDHNAQFPLTFPSASSNFNLNNNSSNNFSNVPSGSGNNVNENSNSNNRTNFLNLDTQQNTPTPQLQPPPPKLPSFANLPSGISLTPLGSKNQNQNTAAPANSTNELHSSSNNLMDVDPPRNNIAQNQQFLQNNFNFEQDFHENFNQNYNWGQKQQDDMLNRQNNLLSANSNGANSSQSWIKQEEMKPNISNQLVSPKSETSNDAKPKINIISDIKLPLVFPNSSNSTPEKKINIISDIKIEPKKEEGEDKISVKQEIEKLKNELKNELKIEDDVKDVKPPMDKPPPIPENPLTKLNPLVTLMGTKEDAGIPYDWAIELLKDYVPGKIENSAKMQILFCIIRESIALGDRLLLFSQSLITLDLIEQFLQSSMVPGDTVKWAKNVSYYRLDGSTHALEREKLINEFNSNPKIHLFLVSTRAGSLGINLIGANRVVVLDASWNPCHDTQAVCRVYRYGQRKPCFVYRLVVDNCLEKKIYDRQVSKQGMSDRVVDECNPDAHLTMKDVSTLCFDDKRDEAEEKDWSEVKDNYIDVVLQKVLDLHGTTLNKEPFQHESLLVDRKEKQLSKHEKRQAKKGYEREKQASRAPAYMPGLGRGHRPVASVRPMQQGERPSRWIPAEHWQRQGMTAQEMTLPLDVVIPTNQPEKGNIVLKAGQKVLVLKSPKGVYMQLESGKIVAIKTAIKGKAEDSPDPMKMVKPPTLPPHMKNNPSLSVIPSHAQKKPIRPFQPGPGQGPGPLPGPGPGNTKLNMQGIKQNAPNLVQRMQNRSPPKKVQMAKTKPYNVGSEVAKQKESGGTPSSSEDEHPTAPGEALKLPPVQGPLPAAVNPPPQIDAPSTPQNEGDDELEKKIAQLKKNISIQRVTNQPPKQQKEVMGQASGQQPSGLQSKNLPLPKMFQQQQPTVQPAPHPNPSSQAQTPTTSPKLPGRPSDPSARLQQSTSRTSDSPSFHETLDSITSAYKAGGSANPFEDDDEDEEPEGDIDDEMSDEAEGEEEEAGQQQEQSDQSDDVAYVSEEPAQYQKGEQRQKEQTTGSQEGYSSQSSYNNYYNYNVPPYQPPPPQNYPGYAPQPPAPHYDPMAYPQPPPPQPYNYNYQGYPQPHYPPPPPQPGYDYSNPHPPPHPPPVYTGYPPYPQQYAPPPHPPQAVYPPPHTPQPPQTQQQPYQDYSGYQSGSNSQYYQGS